MKSPIKLNKRFVQIIELAHKNIHLANSFEKGCIKRAMEWGILKRGKAVYPSEICCAYEVCLKIVPIPELAKSTNRMFDDVERDEF